MYHPKHNLLRFFWKSFGACLEKQEKINKIKLSKNPLGPVW
jgi:hypothetical protein